MPLILIPTPIGNLGDITLRALEELKNADLIACEDTRHSGLLLNHYGIKKPLLSYQKFNEQSRVDEILSRLARGERVAVISDAGTPGMSDPGEVALKAAIDAGYPVDVEPRQGADMNWQAWVTDPNGIRIELMKIEPESPQAQFWK